MNRDTRRWTLSARVSIQHLFQLSSPYFVTEDDCSCATTAVFHLFFASIGS